MKPPVKLLVQIGDRIPVSGYRDRAHVIAVRVGAWVETDATSADGGPVTLAAEDAMRALGLPVWPLAEDVLPCPGPLRGMRLDPSTRSWR